MILRHNRGVVTQSKVMGHGSKSRQQAQIVSFKRGMAKHCEKQSTFESYPNGQGHLPSADGTTRPILRGTCFSNVCDSRYGVLGRAWLSRLARVSTEFALPSRSRTQTPPGSTGKAAGSTVPESKSLRPDFSVLLGPGEVSPSPGTGYVQHAMRDRSFLTR